FHRRLGRPRSTSGMPPPVLAARCLSLEGVTTIFAMSPILPAPPESCSTGVMDAVRDGRWIRQPNAFTEPLGPPEPGRYRLYASYACPWAQRVLIVRELLGIQDLLEAVIVDPLRDERGWRVPGGAFLSELYLATDPDFRGRYTVPCVWDVKEERIVTNDFPRITLDLETRWGGALDLYPEELRGEIDALNDRLYHGLNNAVYEAGFARSQEAYEEAVRKVFATLDFLEERLSGRE